MEDRSIQWYINQYEKGNYEPQLEESKALLNLLHRSSFQCKDAMRYVNYAGCFHCLKIMLPLDIEEYWDNNQTPVCSCGIDSVIPLGTMVSNKANADRLIQMQKFYFNGLC